MERDNAITYNNLGNIYSNNDDFNQALKNYTKALRLDPDYAPAYYNRAMAWLHQQEWKKAEANLTIAADKGINITAVFNSDYQSIAGFEKKIGVKLPKDIAAMLRQRKEQVHISSMKEKPPRLPSGIDPHPFENISVTLPVQEKNPSISSMLADLAQHQSGIEQRLFAV